MKTGSLSEFLNNTEVTDFFVNDKCSECGQCCTNYLVLSNYEINTIKAYIKKHNIKPQSQPFAVMSSICIDMTCPFLDDSKPNHKCTIYKVRPQICRSFTCRKYVNHDISNELYKVPRRAYDVRQTFFGDKG